MQINWVRKENKLRVKGFLVILVMVAALVIILWTLKGNKENEVPEQVEAFSRTKIKLTLANLRALEKAVLTYSVQKGELPLTLKELQTMGPLGAGLFDAWGREIKYEKLSRDNFRLTSAGPDGVFGNDDDLRLDR